VSATSVKEAKARALRAHEAAKAGDTLRAATYDRWLADTLSAAKGRNEATMFTRLAIALEVMVDMRGWGEGVVAGFTARRWASCSRSAAT
jgi:hypothetical protein